MKKQLLLTFLLAILLNLFGYSQCGDSPQCQYTFNLTDSYGDGWNGGSMLVTQNGLVVATLTIPNGSEAAVQVALCDQQPFSLVWNNAGGFPSEMAIAILNPFGQMIYESSNNNFEPNLTLYSGTTNCTTADCLPPFYISSVNSSTDVLSLEWSNSPNATQYEVMVLPAGSPAPVSSSVGTAFSSVNSTIITGLLMNSSYDVYVRTYCTSGDVSPWSNPVICTLECPMPLGLSVTDVFSTSPTLSWSKNSGLGSEVLILPGESAPPDNSVSGIFTDDNYYVANGLVAGESYDFYVRIACGSGFGDWSAGYSFVLIESLPPITATSGELSDGQLVNLLLNSPCIEISNVSSSSGNNFGGQSGIGYFTNTNPQFPLSEGLLLSTGNALNTPGPNISVLSDGTNSWPGDAELENIILAGTGTTMASQNATKLEFDFTSLNEFMSFNFLFASDEYGTYQCAFADAFAFLLTDLETGITTNLAVVPGTTTPVSVITIRDNEYNESCTSENQGFFDTYYDSGNGYQSATNFNGQTALMTASSAIIPNHAYHIKLVVADRADTAYDSAVFIQAGSFTSGPPACTDKIQLVSFIDENGNGTKEINEYGFTYGTFTSQLNDSGEVTSISTPIGTYTFYDSNPANSYDVNFSVDPEYASYYTYSGAGYQDVTIPEGSGTQIFYFPVILSQPYNDVAVSIIETTPPVTGGTYTSKVVYRNLGVAAASGTLSFSNDPLVSVASVQQSGAILNSTGFTYNYNNLLPYEVRTISVVMNVPAIPAVNIDDLLTNNATITSVGTDINLSNNAASLTEAVVASYDPNDKLESHGGKIQFNQFSPDEYLNYTIRFQNTGTSNAINVRLEDILDDMIAPETIRVVSASHDYVMQRINNNLTFQFNFINLPPALQSEALSQGFVSFQVKLKPGFAVGDVVPNFADIYFDSNPAITTNTCTTEFVELLANKDFISSNLLVYPNPANTSFEVNIKNTNQTLKSVRMFDVVGKTVKNIKATSTQTSVDISDLSKGLYMVEITTDQNVTQIRKLIIQ